MKIRVWGTLLILAKECVIYTDHVFHVCGKLCTQDQPCTTLLPTWKSLSKIESTKLVDFINLTTYTLALCILYFQNVFSSVGRDQAATGDGLDIHHGDDYL